MKITLVRHGQPQWVVDGRGQNDPPLTDLGHEQAARLPVAIPQPPQALLVSTMQRALETVAPLERAWGIEATRVDWLREIEVPPSWHGAPAEFVEEQFRLAAARPPEEWWEGLPGGESFRDFHNRVTSGLESTLADLGAAPTDHPHLWQVTNRGFRVVMVAHNGTISTILARLLNVEPVPWEWDRFAMNHASVSRVGTARVGPARVFSLRRHSDVRHLGDVDVTF